MSLPATQPVADRPQRFGFWLFAAHLFAIFSLAASNLLLGFGLLALPWTVRPLQPLGPRARRWLFWLGIYIALLAVSIILSAEPLISSEVAWSVFNLGVPLLALLLVRSEKDVRRIVRGLIFLATLLAGIGLVQYFLGQNDLDNRIRASLSHYMTFAGVLLVCDCLLLAWVVCGDGWKKVWAWVALVVIQLALLGSYTRNAWVALVVVVTFLILLKAPKMLLAYIPLGILLAALAPAPILDRFASIADLEDPSNYDRLCMAAASLDMIKERPIFGLGPEMVSRRYTIYRQPTAPRYWVPHLHSSYLSLAAERGLASLAAFLALVGLAVVQAWRRLEAEGGLEGPRADLYLGALLSLLAFCVAGLFEDNWADTEVQRVILFVMILPFCLEPRPAKQGAAEEAESLPVVR